LFLLAYAFAGGCGDEGAGTTGEAPKIPCSDADECDDENPCTFDFCLSDAIGDTQKYCSNPTIDSGPNPEEEQTEGDCRSNNCVAGVATDEIDTSDAPEDPNGEDCMVSVCDMAGNPGQIPREAGQDCNNFSGVCDAAGVCGCTAPSPTDRHVVDPVNGQDIPTNGGAFGDCAYQTLTYALTQAEGDIFVVPGEYSAANGETVPFVLTGGQALECLSFDGGDVRFVGTGGASVFTFSGSNNALLAFNENECIVEGGGATSCISVTNGGAGDGHGLLGVDISGCTNGIAVSDGGLIQVFENSIHTNTTGISILGADAEGNIENNAFTGNATADIACEGVAVSPNLMGQNNGAPTCNLCTNCPF
jgi:hypothetical protein